MRQAAHTLEIRTRGQGLHEFTGEATAWAAGQGMSTGLLTLFCRHTSASLLIQENADPDVRRDLEDYFAQLAPESPTYRHQDEGSSPAHPYFRRGDRRRRGRGSRSAGGADRSRGGEA